MSGFYPAAAIHSLAVANASQQNQIKRSRSPSLNSKSASSLSNAAVDEDGFLMIKNQPVQRASSVAVMSQINNGPKKQSYSIQECISILCKTMEITKLEQDQEILKQKIDDYNAAHKKELEYMRDCSSLNMRIEVLKYAIEKETANLKLEKERNEELRKTLHIKAQSTHQTQILLKKL